MARSRAGRAALAVGAVALASLGAAKCARPGQTEPTDALSWSRPIRVDVGEAHRGPWRMNESDFRWVDDPTVVLAPDGSASVAWVDQSRKRVLFQRFDPEGQPRLPADAEVSRSPETFSWLPRMVVSPPDPSVVFVAWQEIVFSGGSHGGEILFTSSHDGGKSFARPTNLSRTKRGAGKGRLDTHTWDNGSLDLARGPGGELYVAWTEYEGGLWLRRSTDGGATFSDKMRLAGAAAAPARGPSVAVARDGTVHVVWTVGEDEHADVRHSASNDGARSFGPATIVAETNGHSDAPSIAVDPSGAPHVVFAEGRSGRTADYEVRYTRKRHGADAFDPPRPIAGGPNGGAAFPEVEIDGSGNVYVLWESYSDRSPVASALGFTYSTNGGDDFAPPRPVPGITGPGLGINGSLQGKLTEKLDVNERGEIAVVNSTFLPGEQSAVWLLRGRLERSRLVPVPVPVPVPDRL